MTREEMQRIKRNNVCAECGAFLKIVLGPDGKDALVCERFISHKGYARHFEPRDLTIERRREQMTTEIGEQKTRALAKYAGVTSLTKLQAREIVTTIWPEAEKASPAEVYKAIAICEQYQLNPLMRHLFLLPYWNSDKKRYDYVCVQGIGSNRLIASRKHDWSFLDDTPRIGTEAEQIKHYGKVPEGRLCAIVKMKDVATGKEVTAWGEWPLYKLARSGEQVPNEPKGIEKGNSPTNMACIHAERKGIDMLYPAELPNLPVFDEQYQMSVTVEPEEPVMEGEVTPQSQPQTVEPEQEEQPEPTPKPVESATEAAKAEVSSKPPEATPEAPPDKMDRIWLAETLKIIKWTEATAKSWIKSNLKVDASGTLIDICNCLPPDKLEQFAKKIADLRQMA